MQRGSKSPARGRSSKLAGLASQRVLEHRDLEFKGSKSAPTGPTGRRSTRLFAESDYFDDLAVSRWKQVVHRIRMKNKTRLFSMFAENLAVSLGSSNVAVLVIGMQLRFESMVVGVQDHVCKLIDTCCSKGLPVFVTQHHDPCQTADAEPDPSGEGSVPLPGSSVSRFWSQSKRLPYALCIAEGGRDWSLVPAVSECCARAGLHQDWVVAKTAPNALHGTPILSRLAQLGVDCVVLCGALSNVCVSSTARAAAAHGLQVIALRDALTTLDPQLHTAALQTLDDWGLARVLPAAEVLRSLKNLPSNSEHKKLLTNGFRT